LGVGWWRDTFSTGEGRNLAWIVWKEARWCGRGRALLRSIGWQASPMRTTFPFVKRSSGFRFICVYIFTSGLFLIAKSASTRMDRVGRGPYRSSYIIRAWTLGWKPWRMSARSLCDAGKFQSEPREHCKRLDYFVCQDEA
jgi:hypothetical protein